MNRLRSLLSEPKRLRRLVFLWIPLFSFLWGGCQHVNESIEELGYCSDLSYVTLPDYHARHHRWPVNLCEIENDQLVRANSAGCWRVRCFYYEYRPVMTILYEDKAKLLIRVKFNGGNQGSDRVWSDVDGESESGK